MYKTVKKKIQIKIVIDPDEEKEDLACDGKDLDCAKEETEIASNKTDLKEDSVADKKSNSAKTNVVVASTTIKRIKPVFIYHTVQPGDTLWRISQRYQLKVDDIKKANNISGNTLKQGVKIKIPVKG